MQEPFDMTTIIFALLAAFVVWKLRSVLGTRTGTEKPPYNPFAPRVPQAPGGRPGEVVALPGAANSSEAAAQAKQNDWKPYAIPGSKAWLGLDAIAAADSSFAIETFVKGAKSAYEMIVTAFAAGDRELLQRLLAPEVYESFAGAIEGREKRGETLATAIVSIDKVEIENAALHSGQAQIGLHFTAQMVTATRDRDGAVIEGEPGRVVQVDDFWTFIRDIRSPDPNWKLSATGPAA
jgi:predicted lipid-binding transport protein (Tim44 family)